MKRYLKLVFILLSFLFIVTGCVNKQEDFEEGVSTNQVSDGLTCTLFVECKNAIGKCDEKKDVLPEDGIIYARRSVSFYEGESVFDVLKREMQNARIHLEYSITPVYDNAYIEGIGNLYEFDCGELSGWMFKVNGEFPGVGCSDVFVNAADEIEFIYSCEMGRDVDN